MGYPYYSEVERANNELRAEGKIPSGNVDQDKGMITQRAGYYSYEKDHTIGVLEKTSGNNYKGYSVDILIRTNGDYWDVVTDRDGQAVPIDSGTNHDNELIPRWRKPTRELAQLPPEGETPPPDTGGEPEQPPATVDLQPVLDAIAASEQRVLAEVTKQGEETRQLLRDYAEDVEYWAGIVAAVWFMNQGGGGVIGPTPPAKRGAPVTEAQALEHAKKALTAIRKVQ